MVKVLYEEMGDRAGEVAQQVRAKTQGLSLFRSSHVKREVPLVSLSCV